MNEAETKQLKDCRNLVRNATAKLSDLINNNNDLSYQQQGEITGIMEELNNSEDSITELLNR